MLSRRWRRSAGTFGCGGLKRRGCIGVVEQSCSRNWPAKMRLCSRCALLTAKSAEQCGQCSGSGQVTNAAECSSISSSTQRSTRVRPVFRLNVVDLMSLSRFVALNLAVFVVDFMSLSRFVALDLAVFDGFHLKILTNIFESVIPAIVFFTGKLNP